MDECLKNIKKSMLDYLEVALRQEPADAYDKGFASAMRLSIAIVNDEIRNLERNNRNE